MASWMTRALMVATVGLGVGTFAAQDAVAQESTNQVAAMTDWSVFVEENPKECWGVSSPKETVNTRDGQPVQVRRGDILLFVTFRAGAVGEISFSGGYPFADGSTVNLNVDGNGYELITDGEWAWPGTKEDDAAILWGAMTGPLQDRFLRRREGLMLPFAPAHAARLVRLCQDSEPL